MDDYWDKIFQSVSDDFFVFQDHSYTVLNVLCDNNSKIGGSNKDLRLEKENIARVSLCQWAEDLDHNVKADGFSTTVLRCLLVSTHNYNDYPVDINRNDLVSVARSFGIASAHASLLFAPFTGCATLDRKVSWFFGRPGLRAIAHTDTKSGCTNAIVTVSGAEQTDFEEDVCLLADLARHPLMLAFAIRTNTLRQSEKFLRRHIGNLRRAEELIGFGTDDDEDNEDKSASSSQPEQVDLAKLSRKVASDASNFGNFKVILARLQFMRSVLYDANSHSLKWLTKFDSGQARLQYEQQSEDMLEMDSILEITREGLLEALAEYQNRARNLQSVIFNLIAKTDAEASMALARESGLIAKESRAIAQATRRDGNSMKTIAIMTMVFLPGTFFSSLFAVPTLQWGQSPVIQRNFWVYWAFTIPSTVLVLLAWIALSRIKLKQKRFGEDQKQL